MFKTTTILIVLTLAVVLTVGSLIVGNERCVDNQPGSTPVCSKLVQQPGGNLQANVWRGFPFAYATPSGLELLPLLGNIIFWFAAVLLGWFLLTLLRIFVGRALDYNFERLP